MTQEHDARRYTPAYERNHEPITQVLTRIDLRGERCLEVGSGSGQHVCHFAREVRRDSGEPLVWQPTEQAGQMESIEAWRRVLGVESSVLAPRAIDLLEASWDEGLGAGYGLVMSINVAHIVAWEGVVHLVEGAARLLGEGGVLFFYGPFRYEGRELEPSNASFEGWLKQRDMASGIRVFEEIEALASACGMRHEGDIAMPANNRSIWFRK